MLETTLETFRFDYECEFDYKYDFVETFRLDFEYEFDYEYDVLETLTLDQFDYGYDFFRPLDLTTNTSLTTGTTS